MRQIACMPAVVLASLAVPGRNLIGSCSVMLSRYSPASRHCSGSKDVASGTVFLDRMGLPPVRFVPSDHLTQKAVAEIPSSVSRESLL